MERVTWQTIAVLRALLEAAHHVTEPAPHGFGLMQTTGLKAGTMYTILARLEADGMVTSTWDEEYHRRGPRRRLYELTAGGAAAARNLVREFDSKSSSASTRLRPA